MLTVMRTLYMTNKLSIEHYFLWYFRFHYQDGITITDFLCKVSTMDVQAGYSSCHFLPLDFLNGTIDFKGYFAVGNDN